MGILSWLKRGRLDEQDFQDEIRAHLAIAQQERTAEGEDEQSARYAALRDFGNVTRTTEAARSVWTPPACSRRSSASSSAAGSAHAWNSGSRARAAAAPTAPTST